MVNSGASRRAHDGKPVSQRRQQQLKQLKSLSLHPNDGDGDNIIIPVTRAMASHSADSSRKFSYLTSDALYPVATAEVCEIFPFDLAFSMTVHKAQGRTIHRVVLDLTSHPTDFCLMEFAAVFVAMSRVKEKGHIRLLSHKLPGTGRFNSREAYSYITRLHPSEYVMAFYKGYDTDPGFEIQNTAADPNGMTWNPNVALTYNVN